MPNPFLLMAVFYLFVALIAAVDAAFTSFTLLPWFAGVPWLRVHFITLGVLTEAVFGVLPAFAAGRRGTDTPSTRWDIWLTLNSGIVLLLAGIPSVNSGLIILGGTLVFAAVILLIMQLRNLGGTESQSTGSFKFYIAGLTYQLVGILIGTGLWVGWSGPLQIGVPKEAHIHANSWGFASLFFAGLLIDLLPALTGAPLAGRRSVTPLLGHDAWRAWAGDGALAQRQSGGAGAGAAVAFDRHDLAIGAADQGAAPKRSLCQSAGMAFGCIVLMDSAASVDGPIGHPPDTWRSRCRH
ncbi:MAG: hypothetical protein IPK16_28425 [Anaerolineales bacterium]|nr:hypothetical protein [Anaerolineales bacterium]